MLQKWIKNDLTTNSTLSEVRIVRKSSTRKSISQDQDDYPLSTHFEVGRAEHRRGLLCTEESNLLPPSGLSGLQLDFKYSKRPKYDPQEPDSEDDRASVLIQHTANRQYGESQSALPGIESFDHVPSSRPLQAIQSPPAICSQLLEYPSTQNCTLCSNGTKRSGGFITGKPHCSGPCLNGQMGVYSTKWSEPIDYRLSTLPPTDPEIDSTYDSYDSSPYPGSTSIEELPELEFELDIDNDHVTRRSSCPDPTIVLENPHRTNLEKLKKRRTGLYPRPSCAISGTRSDPGSTRRDRHDRRTAQVKAQRLRDRTYRSQSVPNYENGSARGISLSTPNNQETGPKRKHCAFVQEQELQCLFDDRVGTPHLSELQPGDDVNAQFIVEELGVRGEVAVFSIGDQAMHDPSTFEVTDIPDEELRLL